MSFIQDLVKKQLREWFPDQTIQENFKHPLLLGMEIDLFLPEMKVAIEVNGLQHYLKVKKFFKTEEDFSKQIKRDYIKEKILKRAGIKFLPIKHRNDALDVLLFRITWFTDKKLSVDTTLKQMLINQWKHKRDSFFSNIEGDICKSSVYFNPQHKSLFTLLMNQKKYKEAYSFLLKYGEIKKEQKEKLYSNLYGREKL